MNTITKLAAALAVTTTLGGTAHAAQFGTDESKGWRIITMKGDIVDGDAKRFEAVLAGMPRDKPIVTVLESEGGMLLEGILIGSAIRDAKVDTAVFTHCYSSCAMAWLAGTNKRMVGAGAQVGFHAAYAGKNTTAVSGPGAAMMGYYICQLQLPPEAAIWATKAGPKDISLMTPTVAQQMHITAQFLPAKS